MLISLFWRNGILWFHLVPEIRFGQEDAAGERSVLEHR